MRYREIRPCALLDGWVRCFWILEDESGDSLDTPEQVVPDGCMEFIVHYGAPMTASRNHVDPAESELAVVAGQITSVVHLMRQGTVGIIAARLEPSASSILYRGDVSALTDSVVAADALGLPLVDELIDAVQDARDDHTRVALMEAWLLNTVGDHMESTAPLEHATRLIHAAQGGIEISAVARQLNLSTRSLERKFKHGIGLTPKQFARVVRFRSVFQTVAACVPVSWADVALRCGYVDQSHLVRDFGSFAGIPPSQFLRESGAMARHLALPPMPQPT